MVVEAHMLSKWHKEASKWAKNTYLGTQVVLGHLEKVVFDEDSTHTGPRTAQNMAKRASGGQKRTSGNPQKWGLSRGITIRSVQPKVWPVSVLDPNKAKLGQQTITAEKQTAHGNKGSPHLA